VDGPPEGGHYVRSAAIVDEKGVRPLFSRCDQKGSYPFSLFRLGANHLDAAIPAGFGVLCGDPSSVV